MKKEFTIFNDNLGTVLSGVVVLDTKASEETLGLFLLPQRSFCPNPELLRYPITRVLNQDKLLPRAEQSVPVDSKCCLTVVEAIPVHNPMHAQGHLSHSVRRQMLCVAFEGKKAPVVTVEPLDGRKREFDLMDVHVINRSTELQLGIVWAKSSNSDYCNTIPGYGAGRLGEIQSSASDKGFVLN